MPSIKPFLHLAGKGEHKVFAVFGISPQHCDRAVRHLRSDVPEVPVWLFSTAPPLPETVAQCERLYLGQDSIELLITAQKELWPRWVALSLTTWTGEHGRWPLKLAPFLIPPFRALIMNEHGGFFSGTPRAVLRHIARRIRDSADSALHRMQDLQRGARLWFFALVAQRFSSLSRFAFRKWHGSESLAVSEPIHSAGMRMAVFRYGDRQWNWRQLDELVRTPDARWILFIENDALARIDDLLPLFDDPRTFAASRQVNFGDWKPSLFATAPFRQLQPNEASQTLAPISNVILVDRAKLSAIGVPKTIVPGTAWLLWFWKAAAAGWRSYCVGGDRKLEETPDWPYEEAEFVTRVLSDPELRRLGPREADLSRGSIAFRPTMRTGLPDRPRVLVVSPYLPYPLSHGGAVRIYNLCRALCGRIEFLLAAFREKDETVHYDELHKVFSEIYVVDRDEKPSRDIALPKQVREHTSRSMSALIAKLCSERQVDLLQVEFTHLAEFRESAPQVPAILVEHDLTFTLYRQLAEKQPARANREEYGRWLAFERKWLADYDAIWTMSEPDRAAAIQAGAATGRIFVVPNGVDTERFLPCDEATPYPELFYAGSFRHLPNILGFEELRHIIMPRVWSRFPDVRLRVVAGPDHERHWKALLHRDYPRAFDLRIQVQGFIEDLRPLYAEATVVVVPVPVSAGTNIKVLEAMACQKCVVTTPVGCAGLGLVDGYDAVIRATSDEVADAICDLLENPELRSQIARQARCTVENRYSWRVIAEPAYQSYLQFIGVQAR